LSNERRRRLDDDLAQPSNPLEQRFDRRWSADEVAIDFPSIPPAVDRLRSAFAEDAPEAPLRAEVRLSAREAFDGVTVPLDVPMRSACTLCGGRGESWMEWCRGCGGTGESRFHHRVRLAVPAGVLDGARFRFRVTSPLALTTRVEVLVAIG
jgi:hypothetical protein